MSHPRLPAGRAPNLISLTSFLGWFEEVLREVDRGLEVSGDLRRRCSSRGTRAPVKFSLSKASAARTGGTEPHHIWSPAPAPCGEPAQAPDASEQPRRAVLVTIPLNQASAHFRLSQIAGPDLGSFRRGALTPTQGAISLQPCPAVTPAGSRRTPKSCC